MNIVEVARKYSVDLSDLRTISRAHYHTLSGNGWSAKRTDWEQAVRYAEHMLGVYKQPVSPENIVIESYQGKSTLVAMTEVSLFSWKAKIVEIVVV